MLNNESAFEDKLEFERLKGDLNLVKKDVELHDSKIKMLEKLTTESNRELTQIKITTETTKNTVDEIKDNVKKLENAICTYNTNFQEFKDNDTDELKGYKKTIITCLITTVVGAIMGALMALIF